MSTSSRNNTYEIKIRKILGLRAKRPLQAPWRSAESETKFLVVAAFGDPSSCKLMEKEILTMMMAIASICEGQSTKGQTTAPIERSKDNRSNHGDRQEYGGLRASQTIRS